VQTETPQELMRLVQTGDEEAFSELVRRFKEPITAFVLRMLNDHQKALDVAQETFVNLYVHAGSYKPVASFQGWLFRIAHNLAINELRRRKREQTLSIDAPLDPGRPDGPRFEPPDVTPNAEESILGRERMEVVRRCVASLPAKYRSAIVMKDMQGLTFEEIAAILDCPESTVKSRVMRGRRMIKARLDALLSPAAPSRQPARQGSES
jgi:RNA polymerase sigma-70 factor (ECF subfamily)